MDVLAQVKLFQAMREARNTVGAAARGKLGIEHAVIVTIDCYEECLLKYLGLERKDDNGSK